MAKRHNDTPPGAPSQRQLRVSEEVRHALAAVFERGDFRDPDLANARITVTEVRASPDLKHMTAFISGLGRDVPPEQFAALKRASAFLRGQVSKSVRLKFAPALHFQPDEALEYAMKMDVLMKQPAVARDLTATPDRASDGAPDGASDEKPE
ncbi:MAG: ribosome-binding factor RbfA [Rubritepida sp.]|nr:ribosome-binding factor RbfA [Rubritepida sp.]